MPQGKELVSETQQLIADKNYDLGPIDGILGNKTVRALKAFQENNNLKPTGKIDKATYTSLKVQTPSLTSMLANQFVEAFNTLAGMKSPPKNNSQAGIPTSARTNKNPSGASLAKREAKKRKELS